MSSNNEEKFYLKSTKTEKYVSVNGWVVDKSEATKFTDKQVKRRYGVAITHNNVLKEKLSNDHVVMEPLVKKETGVKIISEIPYEYDDILVCKGEFRFNGGIIFEDMVIYSELRKILRKPSRGVGHLELAILTVQKISGKCIH